MIALFTVSGRAPCGAVVRSGQTGAVNSYEVEINRASASPDIMKTIVYVAKPHRKDANMSKFEKFWDRSDTKWAHPEGVMAYETMNKDSHIADVILNRDIPYAQRKAMIKQQEESVAAQFGLTADPRAEIYWADGIAEEPDAPKVQITVVRPERQRANMPCIMNIPGGGLIMCAPNSGLAALSDTFKAVVVGVKYRSIFDFSDEKEGGYPGSINDVHAAYQWIIDNAEMLSIDPDKIVIKGGSSGSHMALALCHRLKRYDYCGHMPRGCVVSCAICDERNIYPSSKLKVGGWDGPTNFASGQAWLGSYANPAYVPAEAYANHAEPEDCIGLPPTFMHVDENDPTSDPSMIYASKLMQAGVYTELHLWGGCAHGGMSTTAQFDPDSEFGQRYTTLFNGNIRDCLKYDLRRQWTTEE